MITGPGSPSVLSNMAVSIEQHVDWVVDRLIAMREAGFTTIEATETAQAGWARHMADCSMLTLHRLANTWYTGANVPGKAQGVMPYTGGVGPYRSICNEVVGRGMLGFKLTGPNVADQCNDGEIVRLQPDVRLVLNMLADLKLPPLELFGSQGLRDFVAQFNASRPAGRPVGEVLDGTLPVPTVRCPTVSIGQRRRGHIRSWSISMAAAGCWVTSKPTIRSAVTCAGGQG